MRELKYAILGLLNQKSMSGYELSAEFGSALNEFWSAKHSQIYPELKKLTQEGMVTYEVAISGNVLQKKIYTCLLYTSSHLVSFWCLNLTQHLQGCFPLYHPAVTLRATLCRRAEM